ncbi:MAG: hypothetical protein Q7J54_05085 [Candidatus Woesearchaeota archaeon]|nr:hypothetical protein [Candidatus Woesearchaeota archaeon]
MPKKTESWLRTLLHSFIPKPRFLLIMLLDFIFLFLLANAAYFLEYGINQAAAIVGKNKISDLATTSLTQLEATTAAMQSFFNALYLYAFLFVLFAFLMIVIFQGIVYAVLLGKKPDLNYFKNFFLANLIWIPAVLILFFAIFKLFKENVMISLFMLALLLTIYFTNILYILLAKRGKVFKSIKTALQLGVEELYIFIALVIAGIAAYASNFIALLGMPAAPIIAAIVLLYCLAWFRSYTAIMLDSN